MNASVLLRLAPICVLAGLLIGCGVAEGDSHRFESAAERIAAIPLSSSVVEPQPREDMTRRKARDAPRPLKVELMTPHQLWDARDGLTAKVRLAAPPPTTVHGEPEGPPLAAPSAVAPVTNERRVVAARQVQLGAYSSEEGARAAWARLSRGAGGAVLSGLQPAYEAVEVGGRRLVRLKVAASAERAQALCRDLAASDPWCVRSGGVAA